ncbi:MAG TPA: hypothetical protein OIM43_00390 [Prevotellaceae bacterium]|nr:hypothetical protein [Prevotellaceae bacterium]
MKAIKLILIFVVILCVVIGAFSLMSNSTSGTDTLYSEDGDEYIESESITFSCDKCGKQFKLKDKFEKHNNEHKKLKFICEKCGFDTWFNTKKELDQHYKVCHEER